MLKPETIRNKEFEQSVLGGYRRDEVDAFLDEVEADYQKLYSENEEMVEKLKICLTKIEDYRKDEGFLKTAIINAQRLNETTLKEIEQKEKEIESTAKARASEIVTAAEAQAKDILLRAERESADAVSAAREQCKAEIEAEQEKANLEVLRIRRETEAEQAKLDHLRSQVAEFKNTIIELYKGHLTSISKLPDFKAEEPKTAEAVQPVETPAREEEAPAEEPVPVENKASSTEDEAAEGNTVEFKISEKKPEISEGQGSGKKNSKFEKLKFGVGYDINNDE